MIEVDNRAMSEDCQLRKTSLASRKLKNFNWVQNETLRDLRHAAGKITVDVVLLNAKAILSRSSCDIE